MVREKFEVLIDEPTNIVAVELSWTNVTSINYINIKRNDHTCKSYNVEQQINAKEEIEYNELGCRNINREFYTKLVFTFGTKLKAGTVVNFVIKYDIKQVNIP